MKILAPSVKVLILVISGIFIPLKQCKAQSVKKTNAVTTQIKILDIVKDFGADPAGKKNSQLAFENAAAYINKRHGFADLFIPSGNYKVGRQIRNEQKNGIMYGYYGHDVFVLDSCTNVSIHGGINGKTKIKLMDGLKFGSFDTTGKKPLNDNDLNWYTHRGEKGFKISAQYKYLASIGEVFRISNSRKIEIKKINVNGNANKYDLGGNWSDKGRQIDADAIIIMRCSEVKVTDVEISEMGRDGILIIDPDTKDTANLQTHDILLNNISITYSGRNGISWCGGNNILLNNCTISFTGYGNVKSAPLAGIDIEPEGSICKNGKFTNCSFLNNVNSGLISDRAVNEVPDTYNMIFENCKFIQSENDAYVVFLSGSAIAFIFNKCSFYGLTLNAVIAGTEIQATRYKGCLFQDCYKGAQAWKDITSYLLLITGTRTVIDSCTFTDYQIGAFAIRGQNGKKCTEVGEQEKTLIKNSVFTSYLQTCIGNKCPPNGSGYIWLSRLLNNKFIYSKIAYQVNMAPACSGMGNTNLGNGYTLQQSKTESKIINCKN